MGYSVAKVLQAHSDLGDVDGKCATSPNGRTTRQALEDMPYSIQTQSVSILLIQFGLNDCNYWETDLGVPRVSLEAYLANISEMITRAQKCAISKVIVSNNHPTTRITNQIPHTDFTFENSNKVYAEALAELMTHKHNSAVFVNTREVFLQKIASEEFRLEELLLEDGLHLSVKGHNVYLEAMLPAIEFAIASLKPMNM